MRIVGDRFVFQSEVLFPVGQANLRPEAGGEVDRIASAIVELSKQIPPDINWIMRVDGHTDQRPIATFQFPSNWALSSARAIAVVQALVARGVPPGVSPRRDSASFSRSRAARATRLSRATGASS